MDVFHRFLLDQLPKGRHFLLTGAKGVGKTTLSETFGNRFSNRIYLSLTTAADQAIFTRNSSKEEILRAISFLKNKEIRGKGTLLVLDEISSCPAAAEWLCWFLENPKGPSPAIMAISSLIDPTQPLFNGALQPLLPEYRLTPFSFEEFLSVMDDPPALEAFREAPVPLYACQKLLHYFHQFTLVGGMPEIVREFSRTRHPGNLKKIYENLHGNFLKEIEQLRTGKKARQLTAGILLNCYPFAATRIRFNDFGNLNRGSREVAKAFHRLEAMMVLRLVYPVIQPTLPLLPVTGRFPLVQMVDTGLVNYFSGIRKELFASRDMNALFEGQIARHIVGQELAALNPPRFWVRSKNQSEALVDFVIPFEELLIPVVVRSGAPGRLRSLHQFVDRAPHPFAVRLSALPPAINQCKTLKGKNFFLLNLPYFLSRKIGEHLTGLRKYVGR